MLEAGVDLRVVQEIIGHARLNMTAERYTYVMPEYLRKAIDTTDNAISDTKTDTKKGLE